jgi:thiamine biosynthesis lipoprotein
MTTFAPPQGMVATSFPAMGTSVTTLLPARSQLEGQDLVRGLFAEWEETLSRFRPESELSRLNGRAGETTTVSPLLYRVLARALEAAHATGGLYDPTLLGQLVRLGYDRSFDLLQAEQAMLEPRTRPAAPGGGWRAIRLNAARREVTLPPGVGLDFGGIAKGMAVDAAIAALRAQGIAAALVNAGGDLALLGQLPNQAEWPVLVSGRARTWVVGLAGGALATSGVARRHWLQGGRERHHLLDPRTGLPAETGLWSVSVAAARCAQAEVAAKVAFVLGPVAGASFLVEHGLPGLFTRVDGGWRTVGAWPAPVPQRREDGA